MKIQVLVDHLEHDGKRVKQGVVIDVPNAQADALIALGVARRATEEDAGAKRGKRAE